MANKINEAVEFVINVCDDNSHGYSQVHRWGNPDFDCSSLIITAFEKSGVPVKTNGASYTGNMYNVFIKTGFVDVTKQVNLKTGEGLHYGDVLLTPNHHTEIYVGNGKLAGAHHDEKGGVIGRQVGDQTGTEISVRKYYNYPWRYVLRYVDTIDKILTIDDLVNAIISGEFGNGEQRKENLYKYFQEKVNEKLRRS